MALVAWTCGDSNRNYCRRLFLAVWRGEVGTTEGTSTLVDFVVYEHAHELCERRSVVGAVSSRQPEDLQGGLMCAEEVARIKSILKT